MLKKFFLWALIVFSVTPIAYIWDITIYYCLKIKCYQLLKAFGMEDDSSDLLIF